MERQSSSLHPFILFSISIIFMVCIMSQCAYASSDALKYEDGDGITWDYQIIPAGELSYAPELKTDSIEILGCSMIPKDGVLRIPSSIDGLDVVSIGKEAFKKSSGARMIKEAIIPDHVLNIQSNAFNGCSNMKNLSLPEGLRYIQYEGFSGCGIEEVTIPDSLEYLGMRAFGWCSLKKVTIPKNFDFDFAVNYIFYSCYGLQEYCLKNGDDRYSTENGVLYSKDGKELIAYPQGKYDTSFVIPASVEQIGAAAFSECGLRGVVLPEGLTSIGEGAFTACHDLKTIRIPGGVKEIPESCFEQCHKLETVELTEGLQGIGDYAFEGCVALNSVELPQSVNEIGNLVFNNTSSLTHITIPEGVTELKLSLFANCMALEYVSLPDSLISISDRAFAGYFSEYFALQHLYIPENIQTISDSAFDDHNPYLTFYSTSPVAARYAEAHDIDFVNADRETYTQLVDSGSIGELCKPHILQHHDAAEATCISSGFIEYYFCTRCGKKFSDPDGTIEISSTMTEKKPHTLVHTDATTATETEEGNLEYWTCSVCGKVFSDLDGTNQTNIESMIIPKVTVSGGTDPEKPDQPGQTPGSESGSGGSGEQGQIPGNEGGSGESGEPGQTPGSESGSGDSDQPRVTPVSIVKPVKQKITCKSRYTKSIGSKFRLRAKAKTSLSYQSSNKKIATVNRKGVVTVKGYGTCKIRITASASKKFKKAVKTIIVRGRLAKPGFKATAQARRVKLTWTKVKGADGYELYMKLQEESRYSKVLTKPAKVKGVMHRGLTRGKKYSYKIRAYKKIGKKTVYSKYSKAVTVTVK